MKLGYAFDMFVGVKEIVVGGMAEALMPKQPLRFFADGIDGGRGMNVVMERNRVVGLR